MHLNSLGNRLNHLAQNYSAKGDLGPNSKPQSVASEDYLTIAGLAMTAQLFSENDNKDGIDLNPAQGEVHFTAASFEAMDSSTKSAPGNPSGEEMVGSYNIENSADGQMKCVQLQFKSIGSEHSAVKLYMTQDSAQIVALEDQGETFKATAIDFSKNEAENHKVTREGSWAELPV